MERVLVVNVDDFGLNKGQNCGTVEAYRSGIVILTTALANGVAIDHVAQPSHDILALAAGTHFALTLGRPLAAIPGLIRDGLLGKWTWQMAEEDTLLLDETSLELTAQYQRPIDLSGREPAYLDSHHHAHMFPQALPIIVGFATRRGIVLRTDRQTVFQASDFLETLHTSQGFSDELYGKAISRALPLQALDVSVDRGEPSSEMMCHPAFIDDTIR